MGKVTSSRTTRAGPSSIPPGRRPPLELGAALATAVRPQGVGSPSLARDAQGAPFRWERPTAASGVCPGRCGGRRPGEALDFRSARGRLRQHATSQIARVELPSIRGQAWRGVTGAPPRSAPVHTQIPFLARLPRSVGTGGQADLPADAWRGNAEKKRRTRRDQARRPGGRWRSPWWRMRCGSTHKASHPDHRALVARMAAWRRPRSHATTVGKGGERPSSHASSPVLTPARRPMWPATQADIWVSLANGMAALGG